jgi:predicted RNA-binding Zn-ribbon protein involved in translation (DUF1610 family)
MVPKRQADAPRCSTCNDEMELTLLIPPFGSPYGLKVFTCPKCGRSVRVPHYIVPQVA